MLKKVYVIQLENFKFASLEHEAGTHVTVFEEDELSKAMHFDEYEKVQFYFNNFQLYKMNGFGFDDDHSELQFHGEFSPFNRVREVQISYELVDDNEDDIDRQNVIHDSFYDVNDRTPSSSEIKLIEGQLPREIMLLALQWGWNDTEVRESVFRFIRDELDSNLFS